MHSNAISEGEASEWLRRVRQTSAVHDYLVRFSKAAAERPSLLDEEKTNASLRPEISDVMYARRRRSTKEAVGEPVRMEAQQPDRRTADRATKADSVRGQRGQ